ncbi:MAG: acyl-CoA dehydrogenase family protein, partial [bacterium]
MDFSLTSDQQSYRDCIINFARKELNEHSRERDASGAFPSEEWRKAAGMGLMGLFFPEKYGGLGYDLQTSVVAMEALGYACTDSGLVHAIGSHLICGMQINLFGTDMQKGKYLPSMCRGELIGATAVTEPGAGSDSGGISTSALKCDGAYLLNGSKMFISNGPIADVVLVLAVTNPAQKSMGRISCLIVEKDTEGFLRCKPLEKMGLRSLQVGELVFTDCRVPAMSLLGKEGQGSLIFSESMEWERTLIFASEVGAMQRIFETSLTYARQRQQFGQSVSKFQSVSNKIADMKVNLELARLMVYKTAWLKDQGKRVALDAAITKLFVSESLKAACLDAVQIHGAYGYSCEYGIEKELRDSIAATIYSG